MPLLPKAIAEPVERLGATAQNAFEVARFGGLETADEPSPFDIVARSRIYRLRRYFPTTENPGPPVLMIPPMMLAAEVYDVSPNASAVTAMHEHGVDPWVVDFGAPEHEEGGLERTLTDHVLGVNECIDTIRAETGEDVNLGGYSQGGMFAYQTAALRRGEGIASLIAMGSPVDTSAAMPLGLPEDIAEGVAEVLATVLARGALPAWASRTGFRMLDPAKSLRQRLDFLMQLHDREALLPREGQRRFLMGDGFVAYPGPALADLMRQFIAHNRMLQGGFVIEDRLVTLADIALPILTFVGTVDSIAPPPSVRAVRFAAPRADVYEVPLNAGHFGLVVGSGANRTTWPVVARWALWRAGQGERPEEAQPVGDEEPDRPPPGLAQRVGFGLELATGVGAGIGRSLAFTASRTADTMRLIGEEVTNQLPRLARLERVSPNTRISMGLLLDELANKQPEEVAFLNEDRAFTQTQIKDRVDNVVRGLIHIGVHQGDHVGVLMNTRPSGLSVVMALSRLGAIGVLMRPDGAVQREAELGQVTKIIADPELAGRAREAGAEEVYVLGGGGEERDLGVPGVVDMERIDPDAVTLPGWYSPNPGRARDLAFITFSGEGERSTRANRITNGRFALSAFGTASAAALTPSDTVYAVTPIYHPSGLLMSIGGAIAGGSRLALARHFDPETYWEEVRRYGVTVASYTWTMLREIADAQHQSGEEHHPVRLFIGAGMPRGLWKRTVERFAPARVLEFYASTEGEAILVNVSAQKAGSKGRPLPGSADMRLAAYDLDAGHLVLRDDGFAREARTDEVGMLLTRVRGVITTSESPLRGVFERDDAWLQTDDLFRRDEDGDFWLVDHAPAVLHTVHGPVPAFPIHDALGDLEAIDLAAVYGVTGKKGEVYVCVAVTLREGDEIDAVDLAGTFAGLPAKERPDIVHVVDSIPVTTWFRPVTRELREAGVPKPGKNVWRRDGGVYRRLTAKAREKLARAA